MRVHEGARLGRRPRRRQGRRARRAVDRRRRSRPRAPGWPSRSSRSPPTRWTSCGGSAPCCSTASACPTIATEIDGRHVLIVVRGHQYKEDLATLRPYIREYRPVLIGVDGGADAILEAGYRPDMILGDMDSVTDRALTCGAEVVVHAYRDGRAPGLERVRELGIDPVLFPAAGTSEDVAMLLADDKGAELIVAVGTHCGPRRLPRQGPRGDGQHLPHPAAGQRQAGRRQGRVPAVPAADLDAPGRPARRRRARRARRRPRRHDRRADLLRSAGRPLRRAPSWVTGFFTEPRPEALSFDLRWLLS